MSDRIVLAATVLLLGWAGSIAWWSEHQRPVAAQSRANWQPVTYTLPAVGGIVTTELRPEHFVLPSGAARSGYLRLGSGEGGRLVLGTSATLTTAGIWPATATANTKAATHAGQWKAK